MAIQTSVKLGSKCRRWSSNSQTTVSDAAKTAVGTAPAMAIGTAAWTAIGTADWTATGTAVEMAAQGGIRDGILVRNRDHRRDRNWDRN